MKVFACMASTLDGKIGPADVDQFVAIGSQHDLQHLTKLRNEADGVLFGASTFRSWPKAHRGSDPTRHLHHFIMSNSMNLDFDADLFQHPDIPVTVFSGSRDIEQLRLPPRVEMVHIPHGPDQLKLVLDHVVGHGINALLVEGGGHILHQFIESELLDELYLTLVPSIMGDINAPALLGGNVLSDPPRIEVLETHQVADETYLHLGFNYR